MKNVFLMLGISSLLLVTSCGSKSGEQTAATTDSTKTTGSNLLSEEEPKYDKTAIDPAAPVTMITLKAIGKTMAEMKYDQSTLTVPAGSTVKLTFISEATDPAMPHNFLLIRKSALDRIVQEGIKAGVDKGFMPEDDDILVHSKLLAPGEKDELTFPAPPAGEYIYVCTFPGHAMQMQGVFTVN
ncbi:plastocyanin/azurin family copper-binding protein [soil metagenome]